MRLLATTIFASIALVTAFTARSIELPPGHILVADFASAAILLIDPVTGGQTVISQGGLLVNPASVTIGGGNILVVADSGGPGGVAAIIGINFSTGEQFTISQAGTLTDPMSLTVQSLAPECSDSYDNDGDGRIDFAEDPACDSPNDASELGTQECNDGFDNDGDGDTDFPADVGCASPTSNLEGPECDDGTDNDGDGDTDFPADVGCASPTSGLEGPECDDGTDNDGDGDTDFPADAGCASPTGDDEGSVGGSLQFPVDRPGCGIGFGIGFLLLPLMWLYDRRRRNEG